MFILDTNTNENNTVTNSVAGRWWLSDEQEQVHTHQVHQTPRNFGAFFLIAQEIAKVLRSKL